MTRRYPIRPRPRSSFKQGFGLGCGMTLATMGGVVAVIVILYVLLVSM